MLTGLAVSTIHTWIRRRQIARSIRTVLGPVRLKDRMLRLLGAYWTVFGWPREGLFAMANKHCCYY